MKLETFEAVKFGPYRFVGKSVYARAGMDCGPGNFAGYIWDNSKWVFDKLDEIAEYATDEAHNTALLTWEKYCPKTRLLGYTVGRFMKPGTPVPDGMDYFDVAEGFVAKGWFDATDDGSQEGMVKNALKEQGEYNVRSDRFMAEVSGGLGYYISCDRKAD